MLKLHPICFIVHHLKDRIKHNQCGIKLTTNFMKIIINHKLNTPNGVYNKPVSMSVPKLKLFILKYKLYKPWLWLNIMFNFRLHFIGIQVGERGGLYCKNLTVHIMVGHRMNPSRIYVHNLLGETKTQQKHLMILW